MVRQKKNETKKVSFSISVDPILFGEVLEKADELAIQNQTSRSAELCKGLYEHFKVKVNKVGTKSYNCARSMSRKVKA